MAESLLPFSVPRAMNPPKGSSSSDPITCSTSSSNNHSNAPLQKSQNHHAWLAKHSLHDAQILTQAMQQDLSWSNQASFSTLDMAQPVSLQNNRHEEQLSARLMKALQDCKGNGGALDANSMLASVAIRSFPSQLSEESKQPRFGSVASTARLMRALQDNGNGGGTPADVCDKQSQCGNPLIANDVLETKSLSPSLQISEETKPPCFGYGVTVASMENGTTSSVKVVSPALSAQASTGATTTKVSKRRSRASNKLPITFLSADTANFRAMVQKLTGIPTSPAIQWSRNHPWNNTSSASVLKSHGCSPYGQGLPTLDTSAFLLLDGASSLNQTPRLPLLQSSQPHQSSPLGSSSFLSSSNSDHLKALFPSLMHPLKARTSEYDPVTMPTLWDPAGNGSKKEENRADYIFHGKTDTETRRSIVPDGVLMGKENLDADFSGKTLQTVDSWFTSDGTLANHIPEVVHSA